MRALRQASRAFGYAARFDAVSKGSGVGKAVALALGPWKGETDTTSLARLWPKAVPPSRESVEELTLFSSITAKEPSRKAAFVGKARAQLYLQDFTGVRRTLQEAGICEGDKEHAAALAVRAVAAVHEVHKLWLVKGADRTLVKGTTEADLLQEASECFLQLAAVLPHDPWTRAAHGEFLLLKSDTAAVPVLREAAALASTELAGRRAKSGVYLRAGDDAAALGDYADYRHPCRPPASPVLKPHVPVRQDPGMEEKFQGTFAGFSPDEASALALLEADIHAGAFGLVLPGPPAAVNVRPWGSVDARELQALLFAYSGGALGSIVRTGGSADLDADLAAVAAAPDVPAGGGSVQGLLSVQQRLSIALAQEALDRCRVLLARALVLAGEPREAAILASDVIVKNSYTMMYDAFLVRGEARKALGQVEASDSDFKKAFELEEAFEDADIPTMDKHAYRNEF